MKITIIGILLGILLFAAGSLVYSQVRAQDTGSCGYGVPNTADPILYPGWNLVSGVLCPSSEFVARNPNVTAVFTYDTWTLVSTPFWRAYFPNDGTAFQDGDTYGVIKMLTPDHVYWVYSR